MSNLFQSASMDQLVDLLKLVGAALAVIAPVFKLFPAPGRNNVRELEDRHRRVKAFFDNGGVDQHPLLIESAFGATLGHTKLDAREIPLILRQKKPTAFMSSYLKVRSYLAPNEDGSRFELQSLAARTWLRRIFSGFGLVLYALFVSAAMWLLLYIAPKLSMQEEWGQAIGAFGLSVLFAAAGAYCLVEASRLHWATMLFETQHET